MKKQIAAIFVLFIVSIAAGLFFWLAFNLAGESAMNEPPRLLYKVSGKEKQRFITAHVHAKIAVFKNKRQISLGYEVGNLNRNHIHSQKNILHWHGLIKVENKDERAPDYKGLSTFDDFKLVYIPIDLGLASAKNATFILNGKVVNPNEAHWQAGDSIEVHYEE